MSLVNDADSPKRPFLCCQDYGMGGVWCYVQARTKAEIEDVYDLIAYEERPVWMDEETLQRDFSPSKLPTFDIDRPEGWILGVRRRQAEFRNPVYAKGI